MREERVLELMHTLILIMKSMILYTYIFQLLFLGLNIPNHRIEQKILKHRVPLPQPLLGPGGGGGRDGPVDGLREDADVIPVSSAVCRVISLISFNVDVI